MDIKMWVLTLMENQVKNPEFKKIQSLEKLNLKWIMNIKSLISLKTEINKINIK